MAVTYRSNNAGHVLTTTEAVHCRRLQIAALEYGGVHRAFTKICDSRAAADIA
jgi:hypothetical protein